MSDNGRPVQDVRAGTNPPTRQPSLIVRMPPPAWALVLLLISYAIGRFLHLPALFNSSAAAFALFVSGFFLAVWAERTFVHAGTELNPASLTNRRLVTNGPFRFTRNPMYSGLLLATLAVALYFGTLPFFISVIVLFVLVSSVFIPFEEAKMERQFGGDFLAYKSHTRRWGII